MPPGALNVALSRVRLPPRRVMPFPSSVVPRRVTEAGFCERKPKAATGALVRLSSPPREVLNLPPPASLRKSGVPVVNEPPRLTEALGPNMTPEGFSRNRFTCGISEPMVPSMEEALPLVTRARMFLIWAGPVKLARSPFARSNWLKLWKRLPPRWVPRSAGMMNFGPLSVVLGPRLPSVETPEGAAWATDALTRRRLAFQERDFVMTDIRSNF